MSEADTCRKFVVPKLQAAGWDYPTPDELWRRYRRASGLADTATAERLLAPNNRTVGKGDRYYQQIAIHRTIEAILKGQRRILVTMATGTDKTPVAFQICWKLWNARWNRTGEHRRAQPPEPRFPLLKQGSTSGQSLLPAPPSQSGRRPRDA